MSQLMIKIQASVFFFLCVCLFLLTIAQYKPSQETDMSEANCKLLQLSVVHHPPDTFWLSWILDIETKSIMGRRIERYCRARRKSVCMSEGESLSTHRDRNIHSQKEIVSFSDAADKELSREKENCSVLIKPITLC